MDIFLKEHFFNLDNFAHKDIFTGVQYAWEVLPRIQEYIESLFQSGKVKGNHKENVYIGEGTIIQSGAEIVGPAIIGKNCIVGHASFLRENCLLGDTVHIGHGVEVKNSVFLNGSVAAHLNYIGDSIIGNDVNIAGGVMLANYRLDKQNVSVKHQDGRIETQLQKFGAIVGDKSNIGASVVLNPGTILGKETTVYPLLVVSGVYKDGEIIR